MAELLTQYFLEVVVHKEQSPLQRIDRYVVSSQSAACRAVAKRKQVPTEEEGSRGENEQHHGLHLMYPARTTRTWEDMLPRER